MYLGFGASNTQANRIIIAEVDTNATNVTAIRVRAYQRRYTSPLTALPAAATPQVFSHNIGVPAQFLNWQFIGQCTSAIAGFAVGEQVADIYSYASSGQSGTIKNFIAKNTCNIVAELNSGFSVKSKTNGSNTPIAAANFSTIQILSSTF